MFNINNNSLDWYCTITLASSCTLLPITMPVMSHYGGAVDVLESVTSFDDYCCIFFFSSVSSSLDSATPLFPRCFEGLLGWKRICSHFKVPACRHSGLYAWSCLCVPLCHSCVLNSTHTMSMLHTVFLHKT